jgi:hypothetical protein
MSKEQFTNDIGLWLDKMRLLEDRRTSWPESFIEIAGINNDEPIQIADMTHSDYEKDYVAPGWASYVESVAKSATFTTDVSGTYESETLDLTETLNSVENNYGA